MAKNTDEKLNTGKRRPAFIPACLLLIVLGCATGLFSLAIGAGDLGPAYFESYLERPAVLVFNLLPVVLLHLILYMIFGRPGIAFFLASGAVLGASMLQSFRITLEKDVFYFQDLWNENCLDFLPRFSELKLSLVMIGAMVYFIAAIALISVLYRRRRAPWFSGRIVLGLALLALCYPFWLEASNTEKYSEQLKTPDPKTASPLEVYVSRGLVYPFILSASSGNEGAPGDYSEKRAAQLLAGFEGTDPAAASCPDIIALQLDGFSDLSFCASQRAELAEAFSDWTVIKEKGFGGRLFGNDFGTPGLEAAKSFLASAVDPGAVRNDTESLARCLGRLGYSSLALSPGEASMEGRGRALRKLGFGELKFSGADNEYSVAGRTDWWVFGELLSAYRSGEGGPRFIFAQSSQNAGPFGEDPIAQYAESVKNTLFYLKNFAEKLEGGQRPAVLLIYGSGRPDLGEQVYRELGVEEELDTASSMAARCESEYLIIMNAKARELYAGKEQAAGADTSLCFLAGKLLEELGLGSSAYLAELSDLSKTLPVVTAGGLFSDGSGLIEQARLSLDAQSRLYTHRYIEYYMLHDAGLIK